MKSIESPHEMAVRLAQNTWIRCVGLSHKSKLLLQIKVKEHEAKECKKSFGVQYMTLLEIGASDRTLELSIAGTKTELARLAKEISVMQDEIAKLEKDMKSKLVEDPTEPSYCKVVLPKAKTTDDGWDVVDSESDTM